MPTEDFYAKHHTKNVNVKWKHKILSPPARNKLHPNEMQNHKRKLSPKWLPEAQKAIWK
jgi:hypothetical protein